MKKRYAAICLTVASLSGAGLAHFSYQAGFDKGVEGTVSLIQASCESANTVTHLNGKPYVCLNAAMWNKIVAIMHAVGADGSNGGGDADEPPPLPHGPYHSPAPGMQS